VSSSGTAATAGIIATVGVWVSGRMRIQTAGEGTSLWASSTGELCLGLEVLQKMGTTRAGVTTVSAKSLGFI
jgi:hypothetical protein